MLTVKNLTKQTFTINTTNHRTLGPKEMITLDTPEYLSNPILRRLQDLNLIMVYQTPQEHIIRKEPSKTKPKNQSAAEKMDNIEKLVSSAPKKRGRKKKNTTKESE